jgi:hypothetical protein
VAYPPSFVPIEDLLDSLPIDACVQLTRWLLATFSSLPKGAARSPAVLKTVILFIAEYGSTPFEDESGQNPAPRLLECGRSARQEA